MSSPSHARLLGLLLLVSLSTALGRAEGQPRPGPLPPPLEVMEAVEVGRAWIGLPVSFVLLTRGARQYVAYYDDERRLIVASRLLGCDLWTRARLPVTVAWDSHNHIAMGIDPDGRLHLSANLHGDPLVYFRTDAPHDVRTFRALHRMTGQDEEVTTYPDFFEDADGELLFSYRDGRSGNGRRIFNRYDRRTGAWRRLLDTPLLDGTGASMDPYAIGPERGPDGWFHVAWMWRDTPDAGTNHDLSYMRSRDLLRWETAAGEPLALPVTPSERRVIVDPVPVGGGLINMGYAIGFDASERPMLSYHRYDDRGRSQIFVARWEEGRWNVRAATDWDGRWELAGGGSIGARVRASAARALPDGRLVQPYQHWQAGTGTLRLDPRTLEPLGRVHVGHPRPEALNRAGSPAAGVEVLWGQDSGDAAAPGTQYLLRWETLGRNRDQAREGPLPAAQPLVLYRLGEPDRPGRGRATRAIDEPSRPGLRPPPLAAGAPDRSDGALRCRGPMRRGRHLACDALPLPIGPRPERAELPLCAAPY